MGFPHVPAAIIQLLCADPSFNAAYGSRCFTRAPSSVTTPYVIVQMAGSLPIDGRGWAWSPLVQVTGWAPPAAAGGEDPERIVWRIASSAARVIGSVRTATYSDTDGSMTYNTRLTDGPLPQTDTTRGPGNPLYGCLVRAELRLQHT